MFCENCGKTISDSSDFCQYCGHKVNKTVEYSAFNNDMPINMDSSRPMKKKKREKTSKPVAFPMRILFVVLTVVLVYFAVSNTAIYLLGQRTTATITSKTRYGKREKSLKNDYRWNVSYEFSVDGVKYTGTTYISGTRNGVSTKNLYACYLPMMPKINSLSEGTIRNFNSGGDGLLVLIKTVFTIIVVAVISFIFLKLAFSRRKKG